jgi:hypothetical protein
MIFLLLLVPPTHRLAGPDQPAQYAFGATFATGKTAKPWQAGGPLCLKRYAF